MTACASLAPWARRSFGTGSLSHLSAIALKVQTGLIAGELACINDAPKSLWWQTSWSWARYKPRSAYRAWHGTAPAL